MRMFTAAMFIFIFFFSCNAVSQANIFPYAYQTSSQISQVNQSLTSVVNQMNRTTFSSAIDVFASQVILVYYGIQWFTMAFAYSTVLLPKFLIEEWYFPTSLAYIFGVGVNMLYIAGILQLLLARGFRGFR